MKIHHVLNSDFGLKNTMGYRSYQIVKYSQSDITVSARANFADIKVNFRPISPFYRTFCRFSQMLGQMELMRAFTDLKKIENKVFEKSVKGYLNNNKIIHFFYLSPFLVEQAKLGGAVTIAEGFTHTTYIEKLYNNGVILDSKNFNINHNMIKTYELVDFIISPSCWVTKTLKKAGIPESKIIEIYYGVDKQPDRKYSRQCEKIRFMFAGGMKKSKGLHDLFQGWQQASNKYSDNMELHLYGRPYKHTQNIMDEYMSRSKNIFYHSFVKKMSDEYKKNDVYVYPTYHEGSSKTVFEAMSFGLPVITTENAGSIVRDGLDGYIVPINCPDELAKKMGCFLDFSNIKKMGETAQNYSREFTWENYAENVNSFYRGIV